MFQGFFEILPVRWENWQWRRTQVVKNGQKRYFCGKMNNFLLGPARELIFSLKYSYLNILTGKTTPAQGKIYALTKMTSKWPKNDFSDMEFWLLSENRIFGPPILKISVTKNTLPKFTWKTACNDVFNKFLRCLWWTQLFTEFYSKITSSFGHSFLHGYYDGNC